MKIVHVTAGLVRAGAGVREVVSELSRAQIELGAEVHVLGLNHPDWVKERDHWQGASAQVVPVFGPRALGYAPSMAKEIEVLAPDVVHLHGLWMHPGRSVLQWARRTGRPYVLSPHGMLSDVALSYSRMRKRIASHLFQASVFREASAIHVTSAQEAEEARRYGLMNRIISFPNGVPPINPPRTRRVVPPHRVLSLGRIHRKKGLNQLVSAWARLEPDFPEWQLDIIGPNEGGELERLRRQIGELGLSRVVLGGPIFGESKNAVMADCDIFVLPSLSENFALTVAESLMLGVPVISSKGAPWQGLDEEGCGNWVDHGSSALELALRRMMLMSPSERLLMGARGRAWMLRDFSWIAIARHSLNAYRAAMEINPK